MIGVVILALIIVGAFCALIAARRSDARFESSRWDRFKADIVEDDWNQDL